MIEITKEFQDKFRNEYCYMCGSQRCYADKESIANCGHYIKMNINVGLCDDKEITLFKMLHPNMV